MAEIKTQPTKASVEKFLKGVGDEQKQKESFVLLELMQKATKAEAQMWGESIVGFGQYHYKSERSRQQGEWFFTGFSPRKQNLTVYLMPGIAYYKELLTKLGKYKTGGSCLYINKLADVDLKVLKELVSTAYKHMKTTTAKK